MSTTTETKVDQDIENLLDDIAVSSHRFTLFLFNDDDHSMDEVAYQIMKAAQCDEQKAVEIMLKAHKNGKAEVVSGSKEKVEKADTILQTIGLKTAITES